MAESTTKYSAYVTYGGTMRFTIEVEDGDDPMDVAYDAAMMEIPFDCDIDTVDIIDEL